MCVLCCVSQYLEGRVLCKVSVQHLLGLILLLQAQVHQDGAGDEEVGLIGVAALGVLHEHAAKLGRIGAPHVVLLRPPIVPYERTSSFMRSDNQP